MKNMVPEKCCCNLFCGFHELNCSFVHSKT